MNTINKSSWALFIFLLLFTSASTYHSIYEPAVPSGKDFLAFWSAAKLSLSGRPESAYDLEQMLLVIKETSSLEKSFTWSYPPTWQALILPLGMLSYKTAFFIFITTSAIAFMGAILKHCNPQYRMIAICCPPLFIAIFFGQNSLITAAIGLFAISTLKISPRISGILIGLLTIKPHLFILFPVLAAIEKQWRALIWALITAASLAAYSIIILGQKPWAAFINNINMARQWMANGTFPLDPMISVMGNSILFGIPTELSTALHLTNLAIIAVLSLIIVTKSKSTEIRGAVLILAMLNASPYMFVYELTWLSAAIVLLSSQESWSRRTRITLICCWFYPLLEFIGNSALEKSPSPFFLVSMALLITIYLDIKNTQKSPETSERPAQKSTRQINY